MFLRAARVPLAFDILLSIPFSELPLWSFYFQGITLTFSILLSLIVTALSVLEFTFNGLVLLALMLNPICCPYAFNVSLFV